MSIAADAPLRRGFVKAGGLIADLQSCRQVARIEVHSKDGTKFRNYDGDFGKLLASFAYAELFKPYCGGNVPERIVIIGRVGGVPWYAGTLVPASGRPPVGLYAPP
ncbi:hypothetical protein [Pseudomonas sp. 10-1B]|uniref:hypothetical protein n=1 Tax=Pseudomonas sp. 10-1B TaxID=1546029 RepID=UPI000A46FBAD|nr:hypothetical protein [Pseudomonas sp. 10-1B]